MKIFLEALGHISSFLMYTMDLYLWEFDRCLRYVLDMRGQGNRGKVAKIYILSITLVSFVDTADLPEILWGKSLVIDMMDVMATLSAFRR